MRGRRRSRASPIRNQFCPITQMSHLQILHWRRTHNRPIVQAQQNSDFPPPQSAIRYGTSLTSVSWFSKFCHPLRDVSRPAIIRRITCQYVSGCVKRRYQADDSRFYESRGEDDETSISVPPPFSAILILHLRSGEWKYLDRNKRSKDFHHSAVRRTPPVRSSGKPRDNGAAKIPVHSSRKLRGLYYGTLHSRRGFSIED